MSHVVKIDMKLMSLNVIIKTFRDLGMEVVESPNYKWYNTYVGDSPLPEGYSIDELGKCIYKAYIPSKPSAYEVGIVKSKDGTGFSLLYDFWMEGYGLESVIGKNANKFKQTYSANMSIMQLAMQGRQFTKTVNTKGQIIIVANT